MSLYGKSVVDEPGYIDAMFGLTSKNKIGVVANISGLLKDAYLVPIHGEFKFIVEILFLLNNSENQPVPEFMQPLTGTGLPDEHPAILLALLVKKSEKKKHKK